jgi:hypothetical protein
MNAALRVLARVGGHNNGAAADATIALMQRAQDRLHALINHELHQWLRDCDDYDTKMVKQGGGGGGTAMAVTDIIRSPSFAKYVSSNDYKQSKTKLKVFSASLLHFLLLFVVCCVFCDYDMK